VSLHVHQHPTPIRERNEPPAASGQDAGPDLGERLLPKARAAHYVGSARNFRRLVAGAKTERRSHPGAAVRRCGRQVLEAAFDSAPSCTTPTASPS
jgi:hypothetical protein